MLGVSAIMAWLQTMMKQKARRVSAFVCIAVPLCVISAIRAYTVGADTSMYAIDWALPEIRSSSLADIFQAGRWEIGFAILCKLMFLFPNPARALLFFSSLIIFSITTFAIFHLTDKPAVAFTLYLLSGTFYNDLSLMRQAIAMSLFLIGLIPLRRGKTPIYCIIIIFAALFHKSALVMLLLPILMWILRRKSKRLTAIGIVIGLFLILLTPISLLEKLLGGAGYDNYVQNEQFGSSGHLTPILYIICFLLWQISYRISTRLEETKNSVSSTYINKNETNLVYGIIILGFIISFASLRLAILFRIAAYCFVAITPLLANSRNTSISGRSNSIGVTLLYAPYIVLFIFTTYRVPTWTAVFPYELMDFSNDFMFSSNFF